jgi:DNA-binding winged helix-turn-helix (wHTH) protein
MANVVAFGDFRLDVGRRKLTRNGAPVRVSGRGVDVLCVLAAAHGRVVSKDELIDRVWPGSAMGDNRLHVRISALRRVFDAAGGGGFVVTVPGAAIV